MTLFPKVVELLREQGADDVVVFGGGIIPDEDIPTLKEQGVAAIFTPGTPMKRSPTGSRQRPRARLRRAPPDRAAPPRPRPPTRHRPLHHTRSHPMDLVEFQGKQLFGRNGVPVPPTRQRLPHRRRDRRGRRGAPRRRRGRRRGQGPGQDRRPRQGRRGQARHLGRGGARARESILGLDIKGHTSSTSSTSSRPPTSPRSTTCR
jgi:hypothetical protein